jgi:hypothetical protein
VVHVAADRETVFDVIAAPYLGKTPRAMAAKLRVLERGADLVVAEHFTKVGRRTAVTVETVRFDRPGRVDFRLIRGPVPEVTESFELTPEGDGTQFTYSGVLGADLGWLGAVWGNVVGRKWEQTVEASIASIKQEAEPGSSRRDGAPSVGAPRLTKELLRIEAMRPFAELVSAAQPARSDPRFRSGTRPTTERRTDAGGSGRRTRATSHQPRP